MPDGIFLALMVGLSATVGFLLGLSAADATSLSNWLFEWQTLIAGMTAVAAAYITVLQMRRTDRAHQERHDQAFASIKDQDGLKVRRAKRVTSGILQAISQRCSEIEPLIAGETTLEILAERSANFAAIGERLAAATSQAALDMARSLFDVDTEMAYQNLIDFGLAIERNSTTMRDFAIQLKDLQSAVRADAMLMQYCAWVPDAVAQLNDGLEDLSKKFEP